jgi:hypothetical protein
LQFKANYKQADRPGRLEHVAHHLGNNLSVDLRRRWALDH